MKEEIIILEDEVIALTKQIKLRSREISALSSTYGLRNYLCTLHINLTSLERAVSELKTTLNSQGVSV